MIGKMVVVIASVALALCVCSCSQEGRDEAIGRFEKAARAINGDVRPNDREHETPNIVVEQQRKERIRQNTKWTPENKAQHPLEYCQAQLEKLQSNSRSLEASAHETACAIAKTEREIANADAQVQQLEKFLATAKKAYRECEASGRWPANIGGFSLSKEKTRDKIVEAANKCKELVSSTSDRNNRLAMLKKQMKKTRDEQRELVTTREKLQNLMNDLKIKKIAEGDDGVTASLDAIADSMKALGADFDDPNLESLVQPDERAANDELFEKIMAE